MFAINPEFRKKGEILLRSSRIGNKDCLTAILEEEGALEKKKSCTAELFTLLPRTYLEQHCFRGEVKLRVTAVCTVR